MLRFSLIAASVAVFTAAGCLAESSSDPANTADTSTSPADTTTSGPDTADPPPTDTTTVAVDTAVPPVDTGIECIVDGNECVGDGECCAGHCDLGAQGAPGIGLCFSLRADGESCSDAKYCSSGQCNGNVCGAAVCVAVDGICSNNSECCTGYCGGSAYGPSNCLALLADGLACDGDASCVSGHCADGVCGQQCSAVGGDCSADGGCCDGFCDTGDFGGVANTCAARGGEFQYCATDNWCEDGFCDDGYCGVPTCLEVGLDCWSSNECCSGGCDYTPESPYLPGACVTPRPAGAACSNGSVCVSGQCSDGVCD